MSEPHKKFTPELFQAFFDEEIAWYDEWEEGASRKATKIPTGVFAADKAGNIWLMTAMKVYSAPE